MRLKLIAGNLVIVLLLGLASYFVVRTQLRAELSRQLEERIGDDSEIFARSWRADGARLAEGVSNRAASSSVRNVFAASGEASRRGRAFEAAQEVSKWFQDPARGRRERPHIVAIIDETGRVIARDTDRNRMFGEPLLPQMPVLRGVLHLGAPRYGVWQQDDKLLQVGVAPVRNNQGGVVGALLVGYDLSNGFAQQEAALIGHDLLFITADRIYSTSTSVEVRDALQSALYSPPLDNGTKAALQGKPTLPWVAKLAGEQYVGMTAALPMARGVQAGYVVLADQGKRTALAGVANTILWLMLLGLIAVGIYGFIIANQMMEPIEQMEDDILAVINGRGDVRLEVETPELGGLSYRVNQLINLFTGVAEEDDEGRAVTSSGGWEALSASGPDPGSRSSSVQRDDPSAAALAALPESQYYAQLYREYLAAKRAVGEDVSNIPEERFIERIKGNAAHLVKKHGAQMVRFEVETIDGQVNLKPVVIQ
ncbi:MAG: MXAN_5187 C-terminal domain-containing protein [Polyangiales bacterium]